MNITCAVKHLSDLIIIINLIIDMYRTTNDNIKYVDKQSTWHKEGV